MVAARRAPAIARSSGPGVSLSISGWASESEHSVSLRRIVPRTSPAGRRAELGPSFLELRGGQSLDRKRVHPVRQLLAECAVHAPMPVDAKHAVKDAADDDDAEVTFRTRGDVVTAGFVDDVEVIRLKVGRESSTNTICAGHEALGV